MNAIVNWALDHALLPALVGGFLGIFVGLPFLRWWSGGDRKEIARLHGEVFMHKTLAASEKRMAEFYRDRLVEGLQRTNDDHEKV